MQAVFLVCSILNKFIFSISAFCVVVLRLVFFRCAVRDFHAVSGVEVESGISWWFYMNSHSLGNVFIEKMQ